MAKIPTKMFVYEETVQYIFRATEYRAERQLQILTNLRSFYICWLWTNRCQLVWKYYFFSINILNIVSKSGSNTVYKHNLICIWFICMYSINLNAWILIRCDNLITVYGRGQIGILKLEKSDLQCMFTKLELNEQHPNKRMIAGYCYMPFACNKSQHT